MTTWAAFMYRHLFLLCHISLLRVNFCKFWCFRQTGYAVIEGACVLMFFFLLLVSTEQHWLLLELCVRVWVCLCVCAHALLWSNNCVWCCCNRVCVLVFRPAVSVCSDALYDCCSAQNLSISLARCLDVGAAFRCNGCCCFSVQPACSWAHCQSKFLLCIIYNCW